MDDKRYRDGDEGNVHSGAPRYLQLIVDHVTEGGCDEDLEQTEDEQTVKNQHTVDVVPVG